MEALAPILIILGIYWVLKFIGNLFGGGGSSSSSSEFSYETGWKSDEFVYAVQRGDRIECRRANGLGTWIDGELRGYSPTSVSYVLDGRSKIYHSNGGFTSY